MDIVKTNIIDSSSIKKDSASKILLMDSLIEHFSPLFYEDLRKKQRQVESDEKDISKLKSIIERNRKILLKLETDIKIEALKQKILKTIDHLKNIDVIYGKSKITVQSIIASLDSQSLKNLEKRLALLQKLVEDKVKKKG
jgi:hypothetical protein